MATKTDLKKAIENRYVGGTKYKGRCIHGYVFYDTLAGCTTRCPVCKEKGKISGYWHQRRTGKLKKVM